MFNLKNTTVITSHFNFSGNSSRQADNYVLWRKQFHPDCVRAVELSITGEFEIEDPYVYTKKIIGDSSNILWQKEALLNSLIDEVTTPFVAWIDHDLIFENKHTFEIAEGMLGYKHEAIQLFSSIDYLDSDGLVCVKNKTAGVYNKQVNRLAVGSPGGAWIARTDLMKQIKLPHTFIVGGGDRLFHDFAVGQDSFTFLKAHSDKLLKYAKSWRKEKKGLRCGHIYGKVKHLYHGELKNRKYSRRSYILKEHDFDPDKDIRVDSNGVLEWTTNKTKLKEDVRNYFLGRKEG